MAEDNQHHHGEDRYAQKRRLYDGLKDLPNNVSRANSAVIRIAAIHVAGVSVLAVARAPWFPYLILLASSVLYCSFAVWREKHAKPKQKDLNGTGPP
jgi:hypothetical protein